jgi:DNA-binding transcriptional MerR regulator
VEKSPDAFRTISEVADVLDTPAHVLRFWESRFPQIRPVKRAGGRRYYRPSDVALLSGIRRLLHDEGMTIRGVQKILREQGVRHVAGLTEEELAADEAVSVEAATAPPRRMPPPPPPPAPPPALIPFPGPVERGGPPPPPAPQLPLFSAPAAPDTLPEAVADAPVPDLAARLRALPPGALARHRDTLLPLIARLRALAQAQAARVGDPRL